MNFLLRGGFSMERLISFCSVAEAGSIAAVAQGDGSRQSLISRQIRELEEFFGVALVTRVGRGLALTEAGRELATLGRENLRGLEDFLSRWQDRHTSIRIAASGSVAYWLLLPRLSKISPALSSVRFDVYHEQNEPMVTATREGIYDLCLAPEEALDESFQQTPLGKVGYSLLILNTLQPRKPGSLSKALSACPYCLPVGGRLRNTVDGLAVRAKVELDLRITCASYLHALQVFSCGQCATALPDLVLDSLPAASFHRFPLPLEYRLTLAWRERNASTRPILGKVLSEFESLLQIG